MQVFIPQYRVYDAHGVEDGETPCSASLHKGLDTTRISDAPAGVVTGGCYYAGL